MFYMWIMITILDILGYAAYVRSYLKFEGVPSQRYSILVVVAYAMSLPEFLRNLYVNRKGTFLWWRNTLHKNPPTILYSITTFEALFFVMFFVIAVIDLAHPLCDNGVKVQHILHGITSLLAISALLSLLQAFPCTAYLTAVVQKMIQETMAFMAMGFLSYAAFATIFYILETPFQCIDSAAANDTTTNPQDLPGTMYNAFLRLLNIKTPDDVYFSNSQVPAMSIAVYVFAIIIWPVMLLHFLIALYNDRMQTITQHRGVIIAVQNMNIMLFAHDTYYVPYQKLKQRIFKLIGFHIAPDADEVVVYTSEQFLK